MPNRKMKITSRTALKSVRIRHELLEKIPAGGNLSGYVNDALAKFLKVKLDAPEKTG